MEGTNVYFRRFQSMRQKIRIPFLPDFCEKYSSVLPLYCSICCENEAEMCYNDEEPPEAVPFTTKWHENSSTIVIVVRGGQQT